MIKELIGMKRLTNHFGVIQSSSNFDLKQGRKQHINIPQFNYALKMKRKQETPPPLYYPKTLADLERVCCTGSTSEGELANPADPCRRDPEYLKRKSDVIAISAKFRLEDSDIPYVEYTKEELEIWKRACDRLIEVQERYSAPEIRNKFRLMRQELRLNENEIPQLDSQSKVHLKHSGWRLRPVLGFLTLQEYLFNLAFKMFPATQYMRHSSCVEYSYEPDVIHDVFGHQAALLIP